MAYMIRSSGLSLILGLGVLLSGCNSNDDPSASSATANATDGSPDQVGSACEAPADCYPGTDHAEIAGAVDCLDRVRGGYCTHECAEDMDCCAAEGECVSALPQVCSPFESTGRMLCFLSCEDEDVAAGGHDDSQVFCQHEVGPDFICRSSGGGANNRKVCVPGDCGVGAACADDADCATDLGCDHAFDGGYCGSRDCSSDGDCPDNSLCVANGASSYCARTCASDGDCSFCRPDAVAASCRSDVDFLGPGSDTVCVPNPA